MDIIIMDYVIIIHIIIFIELSILYYYIIKSLYY